MQAPAHLNDLLSDKDVLVLNTGPNPTLLADVLAPARSIRVVDSRGLSWPTSHKATTFERANPLQVDGAFDIVWSNMDTSSFADEDMVTLCAALAKHAPLVVHAFAHPSSPAADFVRKQFSAEPIAVGPDLTVVVTAPTADQANDVQENVVAVWSDRKMPLIWRDSVYANKCRIMADLYAAQQAFVQRLLPTTGGSYVEVGCGTSEMGSILYTQTAYTVGVEINPIMLELARELHPAMHNHPTNYLIEGNALELPALLHRHLPAGFWTTRRVVAIVMNTFGILPSHIRQGVVDAMLQVAGDDGVVVIGCWHADSFRRGVEEYYMQNPRLVGDQVTHAMCDYDKAQLYVPSSGYESHWWSEAELRGFVAAYATQGWTIDVHVEGIGIFLTCRRSTN